MKKLLRTDKATKKKICTICNVVVTQPLNHIESKHLNMKFPCSYCDKVFKGRLLLNTHVFRQHRDQNKLTKALGDSAPAKYD